jgi:hypothetical protein
MHRAYHMNFSTRNMARNGHMELIDRLIAARCRV